MASIRKRTWTSGGKPKTAWIADYLDQGGKRHLKTFESKKAADSWLTATRHEVSRGVHTAEHRSLTVTESGSLWIERCTADDLERSTVIKYRNHLDLHIAPSPIGGVRLASLTAPMVEEFRDNALKTLSLPMAKRVLASLKAIIWEAQRRGLVAQNVAVSVRVRARRREVERLVIGRDVPTKREITALLAAADSRWRPLLLVSAFTGIRASELRGLLWEAVDLDKQVIHVRQRMDQWNVVGPPKSAAGRREIPLTPMAINALKEWRLSCPRLKTGEGPGKLWLVFPNGLGKPESHSNIVNRGLGPVQVAAGIVDAAAKPKYGLHSLRHFYASWAIEAGFSPKRVQALMGHSSIQMTFDRYGHLFPSAEDDHARLAAGEAAMALT